MSKKRTKSSIYSNHWQIAWRKRGDAEFLLISNPKWGWCADPFLINYNNKTYLFAEIFLHKSERSGVIGYCEYSDGKWNEWTVSMDRHWHLSYPNVWVENGKLLMCPESYQLGEVAIYELDGFPDKWKKVGTLISDVTYCDNTFLDYDDKKYMFSYERGETGSSNGNGIICRIENGKIVEKRIFSENRENNRCAGKIIVENGHPIRVAQNCEKEYGNSLIFYEIDSLYPHYCEHEIKRVFPDDIHVRSNNHFIGVHTYNVCNDIEVIDLKYRTFSLSEYFARKRVKKVFINKYK